MTWTTSSRLAFRDYDVEDTPTPGTEHRVVKDDVRSWGKWSDWVFSWPVATGDGDSIVVDSLADVVTAANAEIADGLMIGFVANADNTGAVTLDFDGNGAESVVKWAPELSAKFRALAATDIREGQHCLVHWSDTIASWVLMNPVGGRVHVGYGSAAAPGLAFDDDTGFFRPASNKLAATSGGTERWRMSSAGFAIGKDPSDGLSVEGVDLSSAGNVSATRASAQPLTLNRTGTDGTIVDIRKDGSTIGSISNSGGTVSYNAFCGSHWSQLVVEEGEEILVGTVIESVDEMCHWVEGVEVPLEKLDDGSWATETQIRESDDDRLPKCRVSREYKSPCVYGVFRRQDEDGDVEIAAIGAHPVRIAAGMVVRRGDLLQSAGNGCAVPQVEDVMASYTLGKVISTTVVDQYDDGSYCVPCVLYCG